MKLELPTWAYATVASAGILLGATYMATRPQEAAAEPQKPALQQIVERSFPDAKPAPRDFAERAQRIYAAKGYITAIPGDKHATGTCANINGVPLKDCVTQCPDDAPLSGSMEIDGKTYCYSGVAGRVVSLTSFEAKGEHYDLYFWGNVKSDLTRDGPYRYDYDRKSWQKVQPWWPARKDK